MAITNAIAEHDVAVHCLFYQVNGLAVPRADITTPVTGDKVVSHTVVRYYLSSISLGPFLTNKLMNNKASVRQIRPITAFLWITFLFFTN